MPRTRRNTRNPHPRPVNACVSPARTRQDTTTKEPHAHGLKRITVKKGGQGRTTRWQQSRYSLAPSSTNSSAFQVTSFVVWGKHPTIQERNISLLNFRAYLLAHHVEPEWQTRDPQNAPGGLLVEQHDIEYILYFVVQASPKNHSKLRAKASRMGLSLHDRKGAPR